MSIVVDSHALTADPRESRLVRALADLIVAQGFAKGICRSRIRSALDEFGAAGLPIDSQQLREAAERFLKGD